MFRSELWRSPLIRHLNSLRYRCSKNATLGILLRVESLFWSRRDLLGLDAASHRLQRLNVFPCIPSPQHKTQWDVGDEICSLIAGGHAAFATGSFLCWLNSGAGIWLGLQTFCSQFTPLPGNGRGHFAIVPQFLGEGGGLYAC